MEEIWKDVVGYEGIYQISNHGGIKKIKSNKIKKWTINAHGYNVTGLTKNRIAKLFYQHRLVAMAFMPNTLNLPFINHKDFDTTNGHIDNLEWCTPKQNSEHAQINGRYDFNRVSAGAIPKLTKREIEKLLKKHCA